MDCKLWEYAAACKITWEGDSDGQGSTPIPATLRYRSSRSSWPPGRAVQGSQGPLGGPYSQAQLSLPATLPTPTPALSLLLVY